MSVFYVCRARENTYTYNFKAHLCRLIDSAQATEWYNEKAVGRAIRTLSMRRDELFLVSKVLWDLPWWEVSLCSLFMVMLNAYVYVYVYAHAYVYVLKLSSPLSVLTGHRYLLCFFFLFYLSILGYYWLWFRVHINHVILHIWELWVGSRLSIWISRKLTIRCVGVEITAASKELGIWDNKDEI